MSYFKTTPTRVVKSSGSNTSNLTVPTNGNRAKASATKPAPLVKKCASCGRR
jgi:hypothetical protein